MRVCLAAVAILLLAYGATVPAQDVSKAASRDRELLRRALAAQKVAEEERARATQVKAALEVKVAALEGRLKAQAAAQDAERRRAAVLEAKANDAARNAGSAARDRDALAARLDQAEAAVAKLQSALAASVSRAEAAESEGVRAQAEIGRLGTAGEDCRRKNGQLAGLFAELLGRYRNVGLLDILGRREPFTGLKRVELGNLLEEYAGRAEASRASDAR